MKFRIQAKDTTIFSLLDTPAFGGAEQYMLKHLLNLAKLKYKVVLATNNAQVKQIFIKEINKQKLSNFTVIDAPYLLDAIGNWKGLVKYFISLPIAILWLVKVIRRLQKNQTNSSSIIALVPGFSDRLSFAPIFKLYKIPQIWIEFGPLEPTFKKNWGFPKYLYLLTKNLADHFITISKYTQQSMIKTGGIDAKKISLVYPSIKPISPKKLAQLEKLGKQWRKKKSLTSTNLICFLGRLARESQLELLIKAFFKANLTNWKLVIIGDGPEKTPYQKLVTRLGPSDQIIFTGFVDAQTKQAILSTSQVFVFTRSWPLEGFGISTIEAMNLRLAVINPRFGPQTEITSHKKTGLHFEPNNVNDLTKKIIYLANKPEQRKKIAAQGYQHVLQKFNDRDWFKKMELSLIMKS